MTTPPRPPRSDTVPHPHRWLLRGGRPAARWIIRRRYDVRVHHPERFPRRGPVVVTANHIGIIDGPLMAIFAPRPVHALTKIEMFAGLLGRFLMLTGQVPLDRFRTDPHAVRIALRVLREGGTVGVFPEGTRGNGELDSFRRGAAYLAMVTGAPVVPLTFIGSREPGGHTNSLPPKRARIDIVVGKPIPVDAVPWPRLRAEVAALTGDLHQQMLTGLKDALAETGRDLPGPSTPRRNLMSDTMDRLPVLAVVGRPNVGKSTLVNRILGRREAVVEDVPGVTRDRVSYDAEWNGRAFTVVDTGGWDPDARGLAERIAAQAEIAVTLADATLFVVDATVGITDADEEVVKILRRSGKPVVLAANKVDDERTEAEAYGLWNLGLGEPYTVSALHGRGSGDLLDAVLAVLPEPPPVTDRESAGRAGSPSSAGPTSGNRRCSTSSRGRSGSLSTTSPAPPSTRSTSWWSWAAGTWRFVDTAGIRKRIKEASGHEYYAWLRTSTAIERAEVCVLVLDGQESIAEQDVRILQAVRESGRALVIAFNKWDLVDDERRYYLDREIERDLVQVQWAPRINITARTGWHIDRLVPALDKALEGWETRIGTGALNSFLGRLVAEHPHPVRSGKQPKVLFGTQAASAPPTFVLFTSGKLDAGYERFIERRLREEFGFVGTPIVINVKPREKRKR